MDLLLDNSGDLDIPATGNIRFTTGNLEVVAQRLRIKLRTFLGEWFLDQRVGVPYYRDILVKNPDLSVVRSIFRSAISSDPAVDSVPRLDIDLDAKRRILTVSFDALLLPDSAVIAHEVAPVLLTIGTDIDPFILFF